MNYEHLTDQHKAVILQQRLAEYEAQHFQHFQNTLVLVGQPNAAEALQAEHQAIRDLNRAHDITKMVLDALDAEVAALLDE